MWSLDHFIGLRGELIHHTSHSFWISRQKDYAILVDLGIDSKSLYSNKGNG